MEKIKRGAEIVISLCGLECAQFAVSGVQREQSCARFLYRSVAICDLLLLTH